MKKMVALLLCLGLCLGCVRVPVSPCPFIHTHSFILPLIHGQLRGSQHARNS